MKVFAAVFVAVAYGVIPSSIIIGFLIWMVSTKVMTVGFSVWFWAACCIIRCT